eukprot:TRINITY_DN18232_c0_g1_i1.p2 TRINITY_DN18232_c0_g1~~TRINITY_DN18232_c0_g1_i1.p2  ORF type:complete len:342 (-),score=64.90 TRINITY_DN18232_c0_g1_i1:360-1385(-)
MIRQVIAVLALLYVCSVVSGIISGDGGYGQIPVRRSTAACCIRTYLRNVGDPATANSGRTHAYVHNEETPPNNEDLAWSAHQQKLAEVISSGEVEQHDTLCVDSQSDFFHHYFDFYRDVFQVDYKRSERQSEEEERTIYCPVRNPGDGSETVFLVDDDYDCAIFQSCNNYEYDYSVCRSVCEDYCYRPPTGEDGAPSFVDESCFRECRVVCEYDCVGACFGNFDCVRQCVYGVDGRRRGQDGYRGNPTLLKDMVTGFSTPQLETGDAFIGDLYNYNGRDGKISYFKRDALEDQDLDANRDVQSAGRPYFNVRGGELEFAMSLYPSATCEDLKHVCRNPRQR